MKYMRLVPCFLLISISFGFAYAGDKELLSIQVSHAYVNSMPPGVKVTACFFEIKNTGDAVARLIGVSSPVVKKIGLHSTSTVNGKMRMNMLGKLVIEAGEVVKLEHGGLHLMLWGLDDSLQIGSQVPFTLHFANGLTKLIEAELKDTRSTSDKNSQHHMH